MTAVDERGMTKFCVDILDEASEPVPDLAVVERDLLPGSGRLLPSSLITMVVEVVSKSSVHQDYVVKRSIYAAGKTPPTSSSTRSWRTASC
ncbi:Uma2 family endonuclease [Streptomyces griseochromogenes]|uniref:Uma2 family endonuclease n=1 Tax=Streptomyces griseochromogenes TaxID=68214 RepID=A0ABS4LTA2_9ACTN|nr:Uma2 family endonuclease [Streptomyces griseochromogenes]MBP2050639.1 Uma2 family endonuclease [Streptomyces griseochromogenes]